MARISYSQFSMWKGCPYRWKLNYIDKLGFREPSIVLIFGTAMHEVLQLYIDTIYSGTIKSANELDLEKMLKDRMVSLYKEELEKNTERLEALVTEGHIKEAPDPNFTDKEEMMEFYNDGVEIIRWFKANREKYFMKKGYELVGIELPLEIVPLDTHPGVNLIGYLDLVVRHVDSGKYTIYDLKTSTRGWGKYHKQDKVKSAQLVLYKTYYAEQFNISPDDIDVEFLILKRKINEDAEYAAMRKRVQKFEPAHGIVSMKRVRNDIKEFIETNFDTEGEVLEEAKYPKTEGKNGNNCRFCEFKDRHEFCDPKDRIKE